MAEVILNKITGDVIEGYDQKDLSLIPSFEAISQFTPSMDNVEFSIYNEQGILEYIEYNYSEYQVTLNYNSQNNSVSTVTVDPQKDLIKKGYDQGNYTTYYNFVRNQISSSQSTPFFISQISSDRTEVRVINNSLSNGDLESGVDNFINELNDSPYFEDFRINFGNNNIFIATNILLDTSNEDQYTTLIKLYEPLPTGIDVKDPLTISLQTADEVSFKVAFENKVIAPPPPKTIGGPNFSLNIADKANNDTSYKTSGELLTTTLSSSYDQILNILGEKGIEINVDYSDFNNFIYFGSAEHRVRNFYYKVSLIEEYDNEISIVEALNTSEVSSSIAILLDKKQEIIKNFDGYERYQYYSSGSLDIYPKTNTSPPYTLATSGSALALNWLEDQATNSGSVYDLESVDRLANSLPTYVQDDTRNATFLVFMDMIGQHFDIMWTYTKDISNKFDGDNRLTHGISKDLVKDALVSMGVNVYGNNQSNYDLFTALTDLNPTGGTSIPTGSEVIDNVFNIADPQPQENLIKGIYKRIFHNLPYLLKKKGSKEGLRALINTFGVPGGLLRINEFGGYKADSDLYKTSKEVENLAFTGATFNSKLNLNAQFGGSTPATILFRVKYINNDLPTNDTPLELANFGTSLTTAYTGNGYVSASYSGAIPSSSGDFYKGELTLGGSSVTAPIYNGNWWTVGVVGRNTLVAAEKISDGGEGFKIGYYIEGSSGGSISGNVSKLNGNGTGFAFQELQFRGDEADTNAIKAYVMNPSSLGEGGGADDADAVADNVGFRAPLGTDNIKRTTGENYRSIHPRSVGAYPGFIKNSFAGDSNYTFSVPGTVSFIGNKEYVHAQEPVSGIKNRISEKIRVDTPILAGTTLSNLSSIQQKGLNTINETPDVDYTEVAFSPQNEINDDIAATYLDGLNIENLIGDPYNFEPNNPNKSEGKYLDLNRESEEYFEKYDKPYDWNDYIRLIKYFDSSLFKMIKDFAPAKSNVTTGVVIKQHLLERNKSKVISGSLEVQSTYSGSIGPYWVWDYSTDGTGLMHKLKEGVIGNFEGGGGGVFNAVNGIEYYYSESVFDTRGELITGSKPYPPNAFTPTPFVTQSWQETILTKSGSVSITRNTQQEFYNGELKGTEVEVTDGNLNVATIKESNDSFIAPYNAAIGAYNNYDDWFLEFSTQGAIGGASAYFFEIGSEIDFWISFSDKDTGGTFRSEYLSNLTIGDIITVRVDTSVFIEGDVFQFKIGGILTVSVGPVTRYGFQVTNSSPNPPATLGGDWYVRRNNNGFIQGIFNYSLVYDDSTNDTLGNTDNNNPIYNNVSKERQSTIFMDIDYTSFGSGSLRPINIDQIISNTATRAPIQDSNYTSTGYSNARYKGSQASSLGFNIPYSKQ